MLKEASFKLGPFTPSEETALILTCVSQPCKSTVSSFRAFSSLLHHTHKDKLSLGPTLSSSKGKWRSSVDSLSCTGHGGPARLAGRGEGSAGGSRGALSTRHLPRLPRASEVLAPCHSPSAQGPALASVLSPFPTSGTTRLSSPGSTLWVGH